MNNDTANDLASKLGFIVGQYLAYVTIVAFIIGLIFLTRYLIKKSWKRNSINEPTEQFSTKTLKIVCDKCDTENDSSLKYCSHCRFKFPVTK